MSIKPNPTLTRRAIFWLIYYGDTFIRRSKHTKCLDKDVLTPD